MSNPSAVTLARRRWDRPENVQRRVDALAERIRRVVDTLPPLTDAQREKLAALLRPERAS
jgi:hypothetical protein